MALVKRLCDIISPFFRVQQGWRADVPVPRAGGGGGGRPLLPPHRPTGRSPKYQAAPAAAHHTGR